MAPSSPDSSLIQQHAALAAAQAADRAGVVVRSLHSIDDLQRARVVFDSTWPLPGGGTTMEMNLLRALEHSQCYISGAFPIDDPAGPAVGAALGFLGRHEVSANEQELHLHSHMAAAVPEWRDRHVGTALKQHQRDWALRHDVPVIAWTFDPLVRRNARFNLVKLGAEVKEYLPDFYGQMEDEINVGDRTDRLMAWWKVSGERARRAADGKLAPFDVVPDGARVVALPEDIVSMRRADADEALRWRLSVRDQLMSALADGFTVAGVDGAGGYVLLPGS
jgi:predicted GNAT superfamily acetyltransferase